MFLSLVRPERISSPITKSAAVTMPLPAASDVSLMLAPLLASLAPAFAGGWRTQRRPSIVAHHQCSDSFIRYRLVMVGLVPTIHQAACSGVRGWLDPRDPRPAPRAGK